MVGDGLLEFFAEVAEVAVAEAFSLDHEDVDGLAGGVYPCLVAVGASVAVCSWA